MAVMPMTVTTQADLIHIDKGIDRCCVYVWRCLTADANAERSGSEETSGESGR